MELEFWGVRGTYPVSGRDWSKYGGHTPCATVTSDGGDMVIVDAGTGLIGLGRRLARKGGLSRAHFHILLTHFHLDHILGIPFFEPLFEKGAAVTFYAAAEPREIEKLLAGIMVGRYFPVDLPDSAAAKRFRKLPAGTFEVGGLAVSHHRLNHPQGCVAYRVEGSGRSVVFATDTEHPLKGMDEGLVQFARGAGHFIYDATFTPKEYESSRRGWGHSTWLEGTRLARGAGVGTLYLSHLNPDHDDKKVEEILAQARAKFPKTRAAQEGLKRAL